jgi:hypothetical protein
VTEPKQHPDGLPDSAGGPSARSSVEITISRSGGFAGVVEELASLDTGGLDAQLAATLESRLDEVKFFSLPSELSTEAVGADHFTYSITVCGDHGSHTVSFRDDGTGKPGAGPVGEIVDLVLRSQPG